LGEGAGATLTPSAVQPFAFEFGEQPAATKLDVACATELDVAASLHWTGKLRIPSALSLHRTLKVVARHRVLSRMRCKSATFSFVAGANGALMVL
jgi:transposase